MLLTLFCIKFTKLKHDLQINRRHDLKNEQNSVPSTVPEPLAHALIHFSAFGLVVDYHLGENLILQDFSSPSMVAILVCDSHRQAGSSTAAATASHVTSEG